MSTPVLVSRAFLLQAVVLIGLCGCKSEIQHSSQKGTLPLTRPHLYRILALGDSVTRGSNIGLGNYRRALQYLLTQGDYKFEFVGASKEESDNYSGDDPEQTFTPYQPFHEGYGGFTIGQIESEKTRSDNGGAVYRGLSTTMEENDPDVLLLMLGTNDILHHAKNPDVKGYEGQEGFPAIVAARMNSLVTRIHDLKPQTTVVLATILPMKDETKQTQVESYNRFIRKIVTAHRAKGERIVLADMSMHLGKDDLSSDGVHPNTPGYNKMAKVWYTALTEHKPQPSSNMPKTNH